MRRKSIRKIALVTGLLLAAAFVSGCGAKSEEQTETAAENAAVAAEPTGRDEVSFQGTTLDDESVDESLFADAELTMVNVWATYCSPCISEMPDLGAIAEEYADKGFQMVGIVSDVQEGDDTASAKEIVADTGAAYTHLLLNQQIYSTFLNGVTAVPTTFFVDSEGNQVGEQYVGARSKEEWVEIIEALLQ